MSIYGRTWTASHEETLLNRAGVGAADDARFTPLIRNKIVRHDANAHGRDFIVGDLHGCVCHLDRLMRHVGFDTSMDRLFSVGDLADRGPDSHAALELLAEDWFLPVMGNHDAMLMAVLMEHLGAASGSGNLSNVDRVRTEIYGGAFFSNGGKWLRPFLRDGTQVDTLTAWLTRLRKMPLIRVIGADSSRFHVAHAELLGGDAPAGQTRPGWCDTALDQPDAENDPLWNHPHDILGFDMVGDGVDHVLWGRELRAWVAENMVENTPPDRSGLSRTYVGHTVTVMKGNPQSLLKAESHVFLDTGATRSISNDEHVRNLNCGLTVWCHQEDRGWKFNGEKVVDVRVANGQEGAE